MNILFIIRSLGCGGAERQLSILANGLARRGRRVSIAVFYGGGVRSSDLSSDVQLYDLGKRSNADVFAFSWRLLRLVRKLNPDVLHGYLSAGNLAASVARIAAPRAKVIWALRDSNMDMAQYGRVTRFATRLAAAGSFTADAFIANSMAGKAHAAANGYDDERIFHIPNGIDTDRFYPDDPSGRQMRQQLGISASEKLVGVAARLDPMKDHPGFLKAAALLYRRHPECRFLCAGDGPAPYRERLKSLADSLGIADRVIWIPSCREMRALYSALDVFCLSSAFGEGFPNVLGEAMACARPCVTTDTGDAALVAGGAATVTPPRDPEALAAAIEKNLNAGSRLEARSRIVECFSIDRMVEATESCLFHCVHQRVAGRAAVAGD